MIRRPPRSTLSSSSAASDVYKRQVVPDGDMPAWLPRVGVDWILDGSLANVNWYGRGPQENYPDRKSGYKTGIYSSTVKDMYEPYLIPQDYGLRTDNRWVRMTDDQGCLLYTSDAADEEDSVDL